MTGVRFDQLPPGMQAQVAEQLDGDKRKRTTGRKGHVGPVGGRCHCGEPMASWAAFERHSEATGHRRFEVVL